MAMIYGRAKHDYFEEEYVVSPRWILGVISG